MAFNPFPNKPWFLRVCSLSLLKTLWEKEKLLITSNFSFSHSVFYPFGELTTIFITFEIVICKLFEFGGVLNLSFGKGLMLFSMLFQLYRSGQYNYPCFSGILLTSTTHNILSKPLTAFQHNHCLNNG